MFVRLTIVCLVFLVFGLLFAQLVQTQRRDRWAASGIASCAHGPDRACNVASY
jgi:hypothetical protein